MRQEATAPYYSAMNEQERKVKQDFEALRGAKRDFHKLLVQAKARRMEALQAGNKEEAKRLKEEIEHLNQEWRKEQKNLWRGIRRDKNELRHLK